MTTFDYLLAGPDRAIYGGDRNEYRYVLTRNLGFGGDGAVNIVMVNPSTATADRPDPTVTRCKWFAQSWGYRWLIVTNLFAIRSQSPSILTNGIIDPVGPDNDRWIVDIHNLCDKTVLAWGIHGGTGGRDQQVLQLLGGRELWCLGRTAKGFPKHPLYLKQGQALERYLCEVTG